MTNYPNQNHQVNELSPIYTVKVRVYPHFEKDDFIEVVQKSQYAFSDYDIFENFAFVDEPLLEDVNIYDEDVDVIVTEISGTDGFHWAK